MNTSIAVNPVVSTETNHKVSRYFRDADHYHAFRAAWKASCRENREKGHLKTEHYALYALLRGRDLKKSFSPITNSRKLENGAAPYGSLNRTLDRISYLMPGHTHMNARRDALLSPFGGTVTEDMLKEIIFTLRDQHEY